MLQFIDLDAEENGIVIIPNNYIDLLYWDGEEDHRLERLVPYPKSNRSIAEVINSYSIGDTLCEIYHSGFQTFILGKSLKVTDSHYLIESLNTSGKIEGYLLLHSELIDFICMNTKYINTYTASNDTIPMSKIFNFFDYIIHNRLSNTICNCPYYYTMMIERIWDLFLQIVMLYFGDYHLFF